MGLMEMMAQGMPDIGAISNMIARGLQAQYGQLCIIAGYLKPSTVPQVKAGTSQSGAAGAFNAADVLTASFQTKRLDITLFDNNVLLRTSATVDGNWDTQFELIGPGFYSFPVACRRASLARAAAAEARYSLVAWT